MWINTPSFIQIGQMAAKLLHLTVFKTAVNYHLGFLKFKFFTAGKQWRTNMCCHIKFSQNGKKQFWYIAFYDLKNYWRPLSWIVEFPNFCLLTKLRGLIMHRHRKFFFKNSSNFTYFNNTADRHVWFLKIDFWTAGMLWKTVCHHAKFHQNRSNGVGDIAIFQL